MDAVLSEQRLELESRRAHRDTQGLGLVGAGNHATVVVEQHNDRLASQFRIESPLVGYVKIVAVIRAKIVEGGMVNLEHRPAAGTGRCTPNHYFSGC